MKKRDPLKPVYIISFNVDSLSEDQIAQLARYGVAYNGRITRANLMPQTADRIKQLSFVEHVEHVVTHFPNF